MAICLGTRSRSFLMRHDSVIAWLLDRIHESVRMLHCDLEAPGWGEPFRIVHLWLPDAIERVGRPGGAMKALDGKICGFLAHKLLYGTFVIIVSLFFYVAIPIPEVIQCYHFFLHFPLVYELIS